MTSWNKRFFIPSLLLVSSILSGAVLAESEKQTPENITQAEFLPLISDRSITLSLEAQEQAATTNEANTKQKLEVADQGKNDPQQVVANQTSTPETEVTPVEQIQSTQATEKSEPQTISVKLVINGPGISKSGHIKVEPGSSVLRVLNTASNQLDFSLKTSHHSSLGVFVEGIAGVHNNPKANVYWLYYVNGQFASRGVSLQTVQEGDIITWSYE